MFGVLQKNSCKTKKDAVLLLWTFGKFGPLEGLLQSSLLLEHKRCVGAWCLLLLQNSKFPHFESEKGGNCLKANSGEFQLKKPVMVHQSPLLGPVRASHPDLNLFGIISARAGWKSKKWARRFMLLG